MFFNQKIETMSTKKQQKMQWYQLKKVLITACQNSKFYKKWFKKYQINLKKIKNFKDYEKLPLMDKFQILDNNPFDFVSCQEKDLFGVFSSGGTAGRSKLILKDKESFNFTANEELGIFFKAMNLNQKDRIAILATAGISSAFHKIVLGSLAYGLMIIPLGSGTDIKFTAEIMKKMNATIFWSSAIFTLALTKNIVALGFNPAKDFSIKKIVCSGMPLSDNIRFFLEKTWGAEVFMAAGAAEFGVLGFECKKHDGMHISPEYLYWEILDPETHKPVSEGKMGESVCSSLKNLALPLFRYQMNDLAKITYKKCDCGRTTPRIWLLGRTQETIFIGAHKVYGYQIEEALTSLKEMSGNYQLLVSEKQGKTNFNYKIETLKSGQEKNINLLTQVKIKLENISVTFSQGIRENRFIVKVKLVAPDTLERTSRGKIKDRILDLREKLYKGY